MNQLQRAGVGGGGLMAKDVSFAASLTLEGRIEVTDNLMEELQDYGPETDPQLWHVYANQLVIMTTLRQIFRRLDRRKK